MRHTSTPHTFHENETFLAKCTSTHRGQALFSCSPLAATAMACIAANPTDGSTSLLDSLNNYEAGVLVVHTSHASDSLLYFTTTEPAAVASCSDFTSSYNNVVFFFVTFFSFHVFPNLSIEKRAVDHDVSFLRIVSTLCVS